MEAVLCQYYTCWLMVRTAASCARYTGLLRNRGVGFGVGEVEGAQAGMPVLPKGECGQPQMLLGVSRKMRGKRLQWRHPTTRESLASRGGIEAQSQEKDPRSKGRAWGTHKRLWLERHGLTRRRRARHAVPLHDRDGGLVSVRLKVHRQECLCYQKAERGASTDHRLKPMPQKTGTAALRNCSA